MLSFTSELRYLSLEDRKNSYLEEQELQGILSGPRRKSRARLGGLSDVDRLNDLIQRHEMDTANVPNVEEAETKGKAAEKSQKLATQQPKKFTVSFRRRKFAQKTRTTRQGVVTRPKLACLGERKAAALPCDIEHRTLRTNAHPCADSSNAKIVVDVLPNGGAKILLVSPRPRRSEHPRSKYDVENARGIETRRSSRKRTQRGRAKRVHSHWESERRDGWLFS